MADAHQTTLGFEASQAISALAKLEQATVSYAAGVDIASGSIINYNRVAKQADATLKRNANSMNIVTRSMENYGKTASKLPPSHPVSQALRKLDEDAKRSTQSLTLTWKSMARIFTIQALHGAISTLTTSLGEAVEEARAFGIAIAEVETIAGPLGLTFEQLSEQARNVALAIGTPLDVVAEAQYQLYSNQVGGAVESTLALEAASKLSLAAVTSLNDSVNVVTGTLNSYGLSAARSEEISAKLFRTVELGRVRASELANTLGRTTVIAAQLGVSYEEVLASISTMTIQGQKASDAQTRLTQVMLKLIRPTDAMKDAFSELGVVSAEAGIQAYGFQGFLEELRNTTDGSVTEFAELFSRVRATAGALGITGKAAERYHENLEKINATTVELLDQKVEIIMETNAKQVEKELNSLHVNVVTNFGQGMNELLGNIFRFFGGAVNTMKAVSAAAIAASTAFLVLRSNAIATFIAMRVQMAALAVGMGSLSTTMGTLASSPAFVAAAFAAATITITKFFITTQDEANKTLDLLEDFREKELAAQLRAQDAAFKARQEKSKKVLSEVQKFLSGVIKLEEAAREEAANLEQLATDSLNSQLSDRISSLGSFVDNITNMADNLDSRLKKLDESTKAVGRSVEDWKFDRGLKDLNNVQKTFAIIEKSQKLRAESTSALNRGETKLAESLVAQSQAYAKQGLQIADNSKNRALIAKAEREYEFALRQQQTIYFGLSNQAKDQKTAIESQLPALYSQFNLLKQLSKELKDTTYELDKGTKNEKDRNKLTEKRIKLSEQIKTVLSDIGKQTGLAEQLGLGDQLSQITKAFREGTTGQEMDITEIITVNSDMLAKKLNVELGEAEARLRPMLLSFKVETAGELSSLLSQLPGQADAAAKNMEKNAVAASKAKGIYADLVGNMAEYKGVSDANLETQINYNERLQKTYDLIQQIAESGSKKQVPVVQEQISALQESARKLGKAGEADLAKVFADAVTILQEGLTEASKIQIDFNAVKVSEQINRLDSIMKSKVPEIDKSATSMTGSLHSIEQQAERTANAIARIQAPSSGTAATASHGALFLAGGGFVPRGTDRIAAMLSRGESVNNANSTRQFAAQIQAMNAGITPVYRNAGGNVTIGDVNISVNEATSPQQTAREVMAAFRRETRRGTSRI